MNNDWCLTFLMIKLYPWGPSTNSLPPHMQMTNWHILQKWVQNIYLYFTSYMSSHVYTIIWLVIDTLSSYVYSIEWYRSIMHMADLLKFVFSSNRCIKLFRLKLVLISFPQLLEILELPFKFSKRHWICSKRSSNWK